MRRKGARGIFVLACVTMVSVFLWTSASAGNRQLMSEKMAKEDLKRNLMESVVGYKVMSKSQMGLTEEAKYQVKERADALVKGIVVEKVLYDPQKDVAFAFGSVKLGDVKTIVGDMKRYDNVVVQGMGFGTMTPEARPPLMALRAALLNAYDEMAETLVGEKISSYSEMENFILTKDINHSEVCAAVYGASIPNPGIDDNDRGWGWDESGNAFVKLQLDLRKVKDILGQRIVYEGPNIIEVEGRGAQTDELAGPEQGGSGEMVAAPATPRTTLQALPVPVGGQKVGEPVAPPPAPEKHEGGASR